MDPGLESDFEEDIMSESDSELEGSDDGAGEMQEARGIRPYLFEPLAEAELVWGCGRGRGCACRRGSRGEGAAAEPEGSAAGGAGTAAARLGNNDW